MIPIEVVYLIVIAVALAAAFVDLRTGHIPNEITFPTLAIAPLLQAYMSWPWGFAQSLLGMLLCGCVPYLLFRKQAIGGGDVKILAAVGALAGPLMGLEIELYAFLAAAVFALFKLTWQGKLFLTLRNSTYLAINPFLPASRKHALELESMSQLRFGGAVLIGALCSIAQRVLPASF